MKNLKLAMLGLGEMNSAILASALASGVLPPNAVGTVRSAAKAEAARQRFGIRVLSGQENDDANPAAVDGADIVFIGVLPTAVAGLCTEIRDALPEHAVVVSVAAGVPLKLIESALRPGQPVVRAMPNMPLAVGRGVIGLAPGEAVSESQIEQISALFAAGGSVHLLAEHQMDALNAVSGSGPGYLYYLAEQLTAAAVELGFEPQLAAELVAQTLLGASTILQDAVATEPGAAAKLRAGMWLPGGTTACAYQVFDERGMAEIVKAGVNASAARSAEITRELDS